MIRILARHFPRSFALILLVPLAIAAQPRTNGRLTGTITDQQGGVIPGAAVSAKNDQTASEFRAVSYELGVYVIPSVPSGSYTVSVTAQGFKTTIVKNIKVAAGSTTTADATMQIGLADTVVVTASKYEEEVVNAPATATVIPEQAIEASASHNVAELMRAVPGINVARTSAYSFSVNGRGATGLYSDAQLALIDGRTIYVDYLGAVDWNTVTTNLEEVKQVEVIRGPASAIWGAYAMNGVINIITTPPREMIGTTFTLGVGAFDRSGGAAESDTGFLYSIAGTHAQALNDRWAFKITGAAYTQDAFARPEGTLPNAFHTPYPVYPNKGTTQPKLDGRVDYDLPDGKQRFTLGGGFVSSSGIAHSGLGPLDCRSCIAGYGKADYIRSALRITAFVNTTNVDSPNMLFMDPTGQPVQWRGDAQAYDVGFSNSHTIATKHLISYGGNFRHNEFNHSGIPKATGRNDGGAYFQDEFLLSKHFRWVFGARIDKFDNLKGAVFSPRTTLMVKPVPGQTFRVSYNRAYVAPSPMNNYLDLTIMVPLDLGLFDPQLAGNYFNYPMRFEGKGDLKEKSLHAYEFGYTASVANGRANLGASFYINDSKGQFYGSTVSTYTSQNPPPGWPLPPFVLDYLNSLGMGLASIGRYGNLGRVRNKGLEVSAAVQISRFVNGYANYSWQARPESRDYDVSLYNLPPAHRFNAGMSFDYKRYFGNVTIGYVSSAFWTDAIGLPYSGSTEAYTAVNAGAGVRWGENRRYAAVVKVSNLANTQIQNHIFGDILKRQISGEFRMRF
jgi:outer membrane receptor protein involved in Fe transport